MSKSHSCYFMELALSKLRRGSGIRAFALAAFIVLMSGRSARAQTITWSGTVTNQYWLTPGDWVGGVVPTSGNDVLFDNSQGTLSGTGGLPFDVSLQANNTAASGTISVNSLTIGNNLGSNPLGAFSILPNPIGSSGSNSQILAITSGSITVGSNVSGQISVGNGNNVNNGSGQNAMTLTTAASHFTITNNSDYNLYIGAGLSIKPVSFDGANGAAGGTITYGPSTTNGYSQGVFSIGDTTAGTVVVLEGNLITATGTVNVFNGSAVDTFGLNVSYSTLVLNGTGAGSGKYGGALVNTGGTAGTLAGTVNTTPANSLVIASNSIIKNSSSGTFTINAATGAQEYPPETAAAVQGVQLNTYTLTFTGGSIVMNGGIEDTSNSGNIVYSGTGTLSLTPGYGNGNGGFYGTVDAFMNTFGGSVTVSSGTITTPYLRNTGLASGLGTGNGTATITLSGSGTLAITGGGITNRPIALTGAGIINSPTASQLLTFTGGVNLGTSTLTLIGAGNVTLAAGTVTDSSGSGGLTDSSIGILTLSGSNSFGGAVTLSNGTTIIDSLQNAGTNSALGTGTGTAGISLGVATLNVTGSGTTNRAFTLTGTSTINSTTAGQTVGLGAVTNSGFLLNLGGPGNITVSSTIAGAGGLTYAGSGTLQFTGTSTYTGTTSVNGGVVTLNGNTGALASTGTLAFGSTGVFNYQGASAGSSQTLASLVRTTGDATVQSTYGTSGNTVLTFSAMPARTAGSGATVNFVSSGGTNGLTNKITLTGQAAGFIDAGSFFNGSNYAWYDTGSNTVRAINYGSDAGAVTFAGGTSLTGSFVQTTGAVTGQTSGTFATLNISGSNNFTIASGTLTLSQGGLLKSGSGASTISSGSLTTGGAVELIVDTASASDALTIGSAITSAGTKGLTKSGSGTLTLTNASNAFTGGVFINQGILKISADADLGNTGNTITFNGGTLQYGASVTMSASHGYVINGVGGTIDTQGNAVTIGGSVISGTGALNVVGNGSLSFTSNSSTWTGGLNIESGTIVVANSSGLSSGVITSGPLGKGIVTMANGTTLSNDAGQARTLDNSFTFGQTVTFSGSGAGGGSLTFTPGTAAPAGFSTVQGIITTTTNSIWTVNNNTATFSGNISFSSGTLGGTALTVLGSGSLVLNGNNGFNGGTVSIGDGNVGDGGTLSLGGAVNDATQWNVKTGGNLILAVNTATIFGGAQSLLNLAGGTVTFKGNSDPNANVILTATSTITDANASTNTETLGLLTVSPGATLIARAQTTAVQTYTFASGTISSNFTIDAGQAAGATTGTATVLFAGGIVDDGASRSVTLGYSGPGTAGSLELSGTSTYGGSTIVNAGTLFFGNVNALPLGTVVTLGSAGSMDLNNSTGTAGTAENEQILGLSGSGTVLNSKTAAGSGTLTISDNNVNDSYTFSGTIQPAGQTVGNVSLVKAGASTQILTGTNLYGGTTTITGGVLQANDGVGLSGSSILIFSGSGGVLQGSGTFARTLGSGTTAGDANVNWAASSNGGFAAKGGNLTVALGGTASPTSLIWGTTAGFVGTSQTLIFGSTTADSLVNMVNNIALAAGTSNTVQVIDNTALTTDLAELSGVISGSSTANLVKTGAGTLILAGTNTYAGSTTINGGVLQISSTANLGVSSGLVFGLSGGTLEYTGSNTSLSQGISLSGTGLIQTDTAGQTLTLTGSINTNSNLLTFSGSGNTSAGGGIGGSGGVTKNGSGTLVMNVVDHYTGATTINNGVVSVNNLGSGSADSLGAQSFSTTSNPGALVINGGTLQYTGGTVTTSRVFTIGVNGGGLDASGSGAVNFTPGGVVSFSGSGSRTLTLSGSNTGANTIGFDIQDPGTGATSLTKNGTGTWVLSDLGNTFANSYSGLTTVNNGILQVDTLAPGMELGVNAGIVLGSGSTAGTLQYTGGGGFGDALTQNVTVGAGGGVFSNIGAGIEVLSGTLTKANAVLTFNGGTFNVTGQITGGGTNSFNSDLDVNNATVTVSATNNNYTGPTVVYNSGTLIDGVNNALPAGTVLTTGSSSDSSSVTNTYNLSGFNQSIAALNSAGSGTNIVTNTGTSTLTLTGTNSDNAVVSGSFGGSIWDGSGKTSLVVGGGTQTLGGSNSYTGSTTITSGTLALLSATITNNIASSPQIIVGTGTGTGAGLNVSGITGGFIVPVAQTLSGYGTVTGATTVNGSLTPGTGTGGGTLTFASGLTIGSGANLNFGLGTTGDLVVVAGNLTLNGSAILNFVPAGTLATGTAYDLVTYTGTLTGGGNLSTWSIGTGSVPGGTTGETFGTISLGGGTSAIIVTFNSGSSTPTPAVAYWQGALSGTWATVTSGSTNFVTTAAGTANTGAIPGTATNVLFTANSGSNLNTVLGADFTINSLEFTGSSSTAATSPVTIGGSNTLTIDATGTNGNTPGNGITVDAGSAAHTISSNVALGSSQTWTVNGSPLTVSGTVAGAFGLTKSGTGTLILSASDSYTGPTAVNSGILQVDGSLSGSSAVTVNAATLQGIGTVSGSVALTGSSTLASSGTLHLAQGFSVSGSANTLSNGTVSGNATQAAGSQFAVNGTLNGTDNLLSGASLSGNGSVGATTLNGNNTLSSAGTLTVASLGVNGTGNQISSGTVNATGGTTLANNSALAVNGTLGGSVTTGSGSVLSGTGTLTGALTVSAGARTYPGSGTSAAVLTTDLTYSSGATAEFGVFSGTTPHGGGAGAGTAYDQIVVTGSSSPQLQIGAGTASAQISSGTLGSAASGVTLTLSMTTAVFNDLKAGASGSYQGVASNSTLNNYFVFSLGSGTLDGRFQSLDLIINGTDEGAQTILYGGTGYGRFGSSPGATNTLGDVTVDGQEFALSYTGNYATNSTIGGNDIVLTAIPEPGTWGMILSGFGMLIGIQKLRKRRVGI